MAKAPATVVLTGAALLAAIGEAMANEPGYLFITQEQAGSVDASHISVNTSITDGDKAAAILTDAGKAAVAGNPAPAPASSGYTIDDAVPVPTTKTRAPREGGYPFDQLAVGQSFHVAKTAANPDPASRLASSVSGARVKYSVPMTDEAGNPVMETVTVKDYQRDPNTKGGFAKGADGKRIVTGTRTETRPKMKEGRSFTVASVGKDDPRGEGARVWRTA